MKHKISILIAVLTLLIFLIQPSLNQHTFGQESPATPVTILVVDDLYGRQEYIAEQVLQYNNDPFSDAIEQIQESDEISELTDIIESSDLGEETLASLEGIGFGDLLSLEEFCVIETEGQSDFDTRGTTIGTLNGGAIGLPHGIRVERLLLELDSVYDTNNLITIEPVDTGDFALSVVAQGITDKVHELQSQDPLPNIVINMSFAIVPCTEIPTIVKYDALVQEYLAQHNPPDIDDLRKLELILQVYAEGLDQIYIGMNTSGTTPPDLFTTSELVNSSGSGLVIAVGAAGNAGVNYPFYPAAWDSVISISASDNDIPVGSSTSFDAFIASPSKATYSNSGSIMLPGIWNWIDLGVQYTEVGTSFAAPRYSFLKAMELTGDQPLDVCSTGTPPNLPNSDSWIPTPPSPTDQPLC